MLSHYILVSSAFSPWTLSMSIEPKENQQQLLPDGVLDIHTEMDKMHDILDRIKDE